MATRRKPSILAASSRDTTIAPAWIADARRRLKRLGRHYNAGDITALYSALVLLDPMLPGWLVGALLACVDGHVARLPASRTRNQLTRILAMVEDHERAMAVADARATLILKRPKDTKGGASMHDACTLAAESRARLTGTHVNAAAMRKSFERFMKRDRRHLSEGMFAAIVVHLTLPQRGTIRRK